MAALNKGTKARRGDKAFVLGPTAERGTGRQSDVGGFQAPVTWR